MTNESLFENHGEMSRQVFNELRKIAYERSGISMDESKFALLSARVGKRLRALKIPDYRAYLKYLKDDVSGKEMVEFLNAISTNVTSFFREQAHFDKTRACLDEWLKKGQKRFRFWSAACSTGEEPYSLAMTALEASFYHPGVDIKILCTDIDTRVLNACAEGVYQERVVESVPTILRQKYMTKTVDRANDVTTWQVNEELRNLLLLRRLNLSSPPFPMKGPMDIVFCRNVMIYFDNRVRQALVDEVYRLLKPDGIFMIGHAETLTGLKTKFKAIQPAVYRKL